jgi:serine/threonine protein kinase
MSGSTTDSFINSRIDRYEIRERIGTGGMARVFKAWDTNLERIVAIKILHEHLADDSTFKERFEREAKLVASFSHPNIVQIYDFNMVNRDGASITYMVMPYIPGKNLKEILEEQALFDKRLPQEKILQILLDLSGALDYAHARGMVHRDVKPGNILFNDQKRAVLTDFGIARLIQGNNLTADNTTIGTPTYMSPEQASGQVVDARSDLYALGVIMFEMLVGYPPYQGENSLSIMLRHLNEPVPSISDFLSEANPHLDSIVFKAMAKNPDYRYQSAQEFAQEVQMAFAEKTILPLKPITELPQPPPANLQTMSTNILSTEPMGNSKPATTQVQTVSFSMTPLNIFAFGATIIIVLIVVALLSSIPNLTASMDSGESSNERVESMVADATRLPTNPRVSFESNFESDDPYLDRWPQMGLETSTSTITPDGFYRIVNSQPSTAVTSIFDPSLTYSSTIITMRGMLEDNGLVASAYGIVFHYKDEDNYNVFAVDGAGRFSVWVRKEGVWRELRGEDETWTPSNAVNPMGEVNKLSVTVIGTDIIGYVNDQKLVQVTDNESVPLGNVGIYLASTAEGNVSILVDSYQVTTNVPSMVAPVRTPTNSN